MFIILFYHQPFYTMKNRIYSLTISFLLLFISIQLQAQNVESDTLDYYSMTLEELMNIEMTVASTKALSPRESPGVVTLITSDQIASTGARDLIDVLRLVPGFEFGVDVQGVVGVGLRGNWGHEGKILILLDGQEMNERSFATTQLGHHFPLQQIDRIEIIRGPGSATYGGYAELGVINIVTKKGSSLQGGSLSTTYGAYENALGRASGSFMVGNGDDDFSYDVKGFYQTGNRSDRTYTDIYGDSYSMKDNSKIASVMFNGGLKYKGLSARVIYEDYEVAQRDLFDAAMPQAVNTSFIGMYTDIKYDFQASDKVTITPRFKLKRQNPWVANDQAAINLDAGDFGGVFSDKTVTQTFGGVMVNAETSDKVDLLGGVEYYTDQGQSVTGYEYAFTNSTDISFYNVSVYGQGLFKLDFANITVGARFNENEQFGSAFVPRLGITKLFDRFHTKLLFSQAFRAPSIQNIDPNPDIKPEVTTVFELEAGYKLTDNMHINANLFSISVEDPIVYFYDGVTDEEGYLNYEQTGTKGIELEYLYKDKWGSLSFNYSYYTADGENKVPSYYAGNDNELLGFAQNKINAVLNYNVSKSISANLSLTHLGERHCYPIVDINEDPVLAKLDAETFLNLYFNYRNILTEGLTAGLGVYNLTYNDYVFVQPYNSGHSPLPASGREFIVRLTYNFKF